MPFEISFRLFFLQKCFQYLYENVYTNVVKETVRVQKSEREREKMCWSRETGETHTNGEIFLKHKLVRAKGIFEDL